MGGEAVEKKLYDAASKGDVITLEELLQQDPYLLHGVPFACSRNLLHVATMCGQAAIVEEALKINPQLARNSDSQNSSPLHIAAAQGNVEITKKLISAAPEMCWWRDGQGMNPIHIAAMNGHVEILEVLLQLDPLPALERVHRGETVLHLCVKHRHLRALQFLVDKLGGLVCAKDDDGETLLHSAVRSNKLEIVRYLVGTKKIKNPSNNSMGKSALQILAESGHDSSEIKEIKKILRSDQSALVRMSDKSVVHVLTRKSDQTMVVMVLIATMAFQAAVSPPGGVWQDDTSSHRAGEAVMASTHPRVYKHLMRANTTAFVSSLIAIFLLIIHPPMKKFFLITATWHLVWVSLASIAVSYAGSVLVITRNTETQSLDKIIDVVVAVSLTVFGIITLWIPIKAIKLMCSSRKTKKPPSEDSRADTSTANEV